MRCPSRFAILACTVAALVSPHSVAAQSDVTITGHYFGELRCDALPRAELISLAEVDEIVVARVRTYPVENGPYFQWHDAIYEMEEQADGALHSIRGAYLRSIEGDTTPPTDLVIAAPTAAGLTRIEGGSHCGGALPALSATIEGPSAFPDLLQGSVSHLTQNMRGFERVSDSTNPNLFATEILSVIDAFGAFVTLRVDEDQRTCLYHSSAMNGLQIQRTFLHGVGSCSQGVISFTERGPVLMLDWGGGYRNGAGLLSTQDRRLAAFLSILGTEPDTQSPGAAAGLPATPGAIIPTVDRPADYPPAFAGMGWEIRGVPLGLDVQSTMAAAAPGQSLNMGHWAFERGTVFDREERRPQFGQQRITLSQRSYQGGVNDVILITPTDWHQGQLVHTVTREVRTRDLDRMPTVEALLAAINERYGDPTETSRFTYGAGGMGQERFQRMIYTIRGGEVRNVPCLPLDRGINQIGTIGRSNSMGRVTAAEIPAMEETLADLVARGCEAIFVIEYSVSGQNPDRVDAYRFRAVDVRLLLSNEISEFYTRREMQDAAMEALPDVDPDL